MRYVFYPLTVTLVLGLWLGLLVWVDVSAQKGKPIAPEAGQERVMEVFGRNAQELKKSNPAVLEIVARPWAGEIVIVTAHPEDIPQMIEDIPVKIHQVLPPLPPPHEGVTLLKPGGVLEHHPELDECPPYYEEVERYRWRFCTGDGDVYLTQPIPAPMAPPIAGIPFTEAEAIWERRKAELLAIPGVQGGGLNAEGIIIDTDQPQLLPSDIEGLPVKARPVGDTAWQPINHTFSTPTNPFHGGVALKDSNVPTSEPPFTAGGIVLSEGKPWLVGAGHAVWLCAQPPPCGLFGTLNRCSHYPTSPDDRWQQSPKSSPQSVARMSRWDVVYNGASNVRDAAAGLFDNDTTEWNGRLDANKTLHGLPIGQVTSFTGATAVAMVQDLVYIVSAIDSVQYPSGTFTASRPHFWRI